MTERVIDSGEWTEEVDAYIAGMNAIAGKSGPSPLFDEGPFTFPFVRTHITADLLNVCAAAVGDTNPLWTDPEYGASTAWGSPIGQPVLEACLSEGSSNRSYRSNPGGK
ncbi:hypothetical protein C3477_24270 [Mycobacterium kansasii]|uniref:MaoC family dehydratase n=1 Tax=Mycobacterium kansasii TaxID=1768 RepID=UPI000CDDF892|nr:MaoC family dehydratase [Mycobacterium kansasii]POX87461.1 hypothetical protein C3B43_17760 [Mycobacterium kansasii]POX98197.1 hypothetical protein C3477_24270 [Mycobacterium kansasii]POY22410.1 hypothetical protein C3476_11265 [Mycobacterium kansasii]